MPKRCIFSQHECAPVWAPNRRTWPPKPPVLQNRWGPKFSKFLGGDTGTAEPRPFFGCLFWVPTFSCFRVPLCKTAVRQAESRQKSPEAKTEERQKKKKIKKNRRKNQEKQKKDKKNRRKTEKIKTEVRQKQPE